MVDEEARKAIKQIALAWGIIVTFTPEGTIYNYTKDMQEFIDGAKRLKGDK